MSNVVLKNKSINAALNDMIRIGDWLSLNCFSTTLQWHTGKMELSHELVWTYLSQALISFEESMSTKGIWNACVDLFGWNFRQNLFVIEHQLFWGLGRSCLYSWVGDKVSYPGAFRRFWRRSCLNVFLTWKTQTRQKKIKARRLTVYPPFYV